jgi:hypothetical protein
MNTRPSIMDAARAVDDNEASRAAESIESGMRTILSPMRLSVNNGETGSQRQEQDEAQRQRELDAAMADTVEVVRRQRERSGRRVCSPNDGKIIRKVFDLLRGMHGSESADNDPSFQ